MNDEEAIALRRAKHYDMLLACPGWGQVLEVIHAAINEKLLLMERTLSAEVRGQLATQYTERKQLLHAVEVDIMSTRIRRDEILSEYGEQAGIAESELAEILNPPKGGIQ